MTSPRLCFCLRKSPSPHLDVAARRWLDRLLAANLGDDADMTTKICGQLAGAFYGASGIPPRWLEKLAMRKEIVVIADQLLLGRVN